MSKKGPNEIFYDWFGTSMGIAIFVGGPLAVLSGAIGGGLTAGGMDSYSKPFLGVAAFLGIIAASAFVFIQFIDFDKLKASVKKEQAERAAK